MTWRTWIIAGLLGLASVSPAYGTDEVPQPYQGGTGCSSPHTIAALPSSPEDGTICQVTNGSAADGDCSTTGSDVILCMYDGAAWVPVGGISSATAASTYLKLDASNDPLTGGLTITGSADEAQLTITGYSSQTADLLHIQNSSSVDKFVIQDDGAIRVGTTTDGINPASAPVMAIYSTGAAANFPLQVKNLFDAASVDVFQSSGQVRATPADGDTTQFRYAMCDDTAVCADVVRQQIVITDVSNGSIDGRWLLQVRDVATFYEMIRAEATAGGVLSVVINENSNDVDFRVESNNNANMLVVDGGTDTVNIGTATPVTSAILNVSSTTGAFLPPRMTSTQRDALTATAGMQIYNTTTGQMESYTSSWGAMAGGGTVTNTKCMVIENPVSGDNFLFYRTDAAITVTGIDCIVVGGTSVDITVNECNANAASCGATEATITCTTSNTTEASGIDDSAVDAGDWMMIDPGTVTGTVTQAAVCVTFTVP